MHPKLLGSAAGTGISLDVAYLAVLAIENADASQDCADSVLVISRRYSDERNLQFNNIPILYELGINSPESVVRQSRVVYYDGPPSNSRCVSVPALFSLKVINFVFLRVHKQ
jgi:hypothetical protein